MAATVTSKPPLPVTQAASTKKVDDVTERSSLSQSIYHQGLSTSQKETISAGTILGLKDVFYQNEPDLTYHCALCNRFISLLLLKDHKSYHNALQLLEFHQLPPTLKILLERRNALIGRIKEEAILEGATLNLNTIQLVDDSYEILKQELEDTFESCRKIEENIDSKVEGFHLNCCLDFVSAVGCCSDQNARWKGKMEDCKVYQDCYGNDKNKTFLALYDGYNGKYASSVAANELHYLLLREMAKFDTNIDCKCTFNMLESNDITQYDLIEAPSVPCEHRRQVHKQSSNYVHQIIYTCEELENEGTNHLSSHHPIMKRQSEEVIGKSRSSSTRAKVKDEYSQHMKAAFKRAYKLTDQVLSFGGDEKSRVRWSGCSAVTIVLEHYENTQAPAAAVTSDQTEGSEVEQTEGKTKTYEEPRTVGRLHIANAGNCHAVLVRDNRSYLLTRPHTYENTKEMNRITSAGGTFSQSEKEMRVNGILLTSRGLGNHGDPTMKNLISWEPHCTTVGVDQYAQLLIVATHGVWQVFTPEEAAELLLQLLPQNRIPTPGYISPSISRLRQTESDPAQPPSKQEEETNQNTSKVAADGETGEVITTAPVEVAAAERKSSLSVPAVTSARRSSVTFKEEERTFGNTNDSAARLSAEARPRSVQSDLLEEEEEELIDIRSNDSGNDADVDTDWASTLPPIESAVRSGLSAESNDYKYLSKLLSERLVQSALLAGAKDNISALVLILPGTKLE